ncbi:MAG: 1-(5-phosphoribosyl)-5-[(5-phosphoribosylamino)methylideneamino]imidazole-4-carboxamide isomerase [Actinomycetota bacterium]
MRFEVIPAIDLAAGRLALYTTRGPEPVEAFGGDPVAAARAYVAAGVRWLHVVDMDLAFQGEARNHGVLRAIGAIGVSVQASGGIRAESDVQAALDAGARRVVLGSGALRHESSALETIGRFADDLVVGIEVEEGRIRSRGVDPVDLPLAETLGWLVAGGARAVLVTAVSRVGTLEGPDVSVVKRVMRAGRPVVAAGGVTTIDDLRALRRVGADGAVVGRAAMEGGLDLTAALALS